MRDPASCPLSHRAMALFSIGKTASRARIVPRNSRNASGTLLAEGVPKDIEPCAGKEAAPLRRGRKSRADDRRVHIRRHARRLGSCDLVSATTAGDAVADEGTWSVAKSGGERLRHHGKLGRRQ